jgi:hypothetical protein
LADAALSAVGFGVPGRRSQEDMRTSSKKAAVPICLDGRGPGLRAVAGFW